MSPFQQLRNIDSAFRMVRRFALAFVIVCALVTGFVCWLSYHMVRELQGKIYILANGKAIEAFQADRKDNVVVEARDHISMFHHWFFTLDPDEKVIQANIGRALNLADESARKNYDNLREAGYYTNVVSANLSQQIEVDSVQVDIGRYPYYFKCYATEKLVRSSSTLTRKLVTQGYLRNVSRSDNNPHGFLIQRWETLLNTDVKP